MGKRIFWIFILFVSTAVGSVVFYIHSAHFARIIKREIKNNFTEQSGISVEFDHIGIGFLPPSLSLVNAKIQASRSDNQFQMKSDSVFQAQKIGFSFPMIQAFSRGISINEVFLNGAELKLELPISGDERKTTQPIKLNEIFHQPINIKISKNFSVNIRQIEISDSKLFISWGSEALNNFIDIDKLHYLSFTPNYDNSNLVLNLNDAKAKIGKSKQTIAALKLNADLKKDKVIISSLDMQRENAALHASGSAQGNIDHIKQMRLDLELILRGASADLVDLIPDLKSYIFQFTSKIKLQGTIESPVLGAKFELSKIHYSLWDLDKVYADIFFKNNELTLNQFRAERNNGKLELQDKIDISFPLENINKSVNLQFTNLELADFSGDLKKVINNLKSRIDGSLSARFQLSKKNSGLKIEMVELNPKITLSGFELNNQIYGKIRPYRKTFRVRKADLNAQLVYKDKILSVIHGDLGFTTGKLALSGTVRSGVFDLYGVSAGIDLGAEIGDIANLPLTGNGAISIHVRGPGSAVFIDFDIKQKNANFLNFDFGELSGLITYDDDHSYINLTNIQGIKNKSAYAFDGAINIGQGDDINIKAKFKDGLPDDIFAIFAHQLKKITWLPKGLTGEISADISVGGGYDKGLGSLEIDSNIKTKKLVYQGESISEASLNAGVHKGIIFAKNVVAKKNNSEINGYINYYPNEELEYRLDIPKGKLRNLDYIASLGLPVDGVVSLKSSGKGTWDKLKSSTIFSIHNFFVRTQSIPDFRLQFDTNIDHNNLLVNLGDGEPLAEAYFAKDSKEKSTFNFNSKEKSYRYVLCLMNKSSCNDDSINLVLDADAKFYWFGKNWQKMSGAATIKRLSLDKRGISLRNSGISNVLSKDGSLKFSPLILKGEGTQLVLNATGQVDGSNLNWNANGEVSLYLLEFFNTLIEDGKGALKLNISASGSIENTKFSGNAELKNGFLRLAGLDSPVDNLQGIISFSDSTANFEKLNAQLGGGNLQLSGTTDLYLNRPPVFALDLFLTNNRLKFFPVNYVEFSEVRLAFTGDRPPYLFSGNAKVRNVMMRNNFNGGDKKSVQNARYLPGKIAGSPEFYEVKIKASAENGVMVQNDLLDAEFKGELTLLNNFEFPQITAHGELVKGKLLFRSTPFNLDHAYISIPTAGYFNPQFSIGGVADVDVYHINLFASGTMESPKITLSSSPSLAQEDIISLLAFGFKGEDNKSKVSATNTTAITYSEVGSILLEQMRLSQDLQSKGVKLTVAPSVVQSESNIIRPNSSPDSVSPKVYLQTQLLKKVDATFGSTLGATQSQELDASLQYKLSSKASLDAIYQEEPTDIDATERIRSYGADLKFRWGFK